MTHQAMTSTVVEDVLYQLAPVIFVKDGGVYIEWLMLRFPLTHRYLVGMLESTFKAFQNTNPTNSNTSMSPPVIYLEQARLPGNVLVTSHDQTTRVYEEERSPVTTSFLESHAAQLCNDTAQCSRHDKERQNCDHEPSFGTNIAELSPAGKSSATLALFLKR
jgi:hypothetical protein